MAPLGAAGCLNVSINSRLMSLTRARIKIFYQVIFFWLDLKDGFHSV